MWNEDWSMDCEGLWWPRLWTKCEKNIGPLLSRSLFCFWRMEWDIRLNLEDYFPGWRKFENSEWKQQEDECVEGDSSWSVRWYGNSNNSNDWNARTSGRVIALVIATSLSISTPTSSGMGCLPKEQTVSTDTYCFRVWATTLESVGRSIARIIHYHWCQPRLWHCKSPEPKIYSDRPFLCSHVARACPSLLTSICLPSSLKGDVPFHGSGSY